MANLAIKGHKTRGKEIIEILEMLGGKRDANFGGNELCCWYYINKNGYINYKHYSAFNDNDTKMFTLEEFIEKFPYRVGDKVKCAKINDFIGRIINVRWDENENQIIYVVEWDDITKSTLTYFANGLQPYKEETMEDIIKIDIPKGYEFAGFDDNKQQVVFEKIVCQYPKNFKECCEVLSLGENGNLYTKGYKASLIQDFHKLIICRNAYWKMAGEQMGLDKPWEPEKAETVYAIFYNFYDDVIDVSVFNLYDNVILCFPTEEIRDMFFENFNDLINKCKELL